jgi:NAD(P)H-hydrate epimerase
MNNQATKLLTHEQMQEVDRRTIHEVGVSGHRLMEEAGRAAWEVVRDTLQPSSILVVAGKGNNGGDGLVVARAAHEDGCKVWLSLFADPNELNDDCSYHYDKLPDNIKQKKRSTINDLGENLDKDPDVVVDGLLGIGTTRPLEGEFAEIVNTINSGARNAKANRRWSVASLDIPTGVPADAGWSGGLAIEADLTVTFGAPKIGMVIAPGINYTGTVYCKQISFPDEIIYQDNHKYHLLNESSVSQLLPVRSPEGHKGTFGRTHLLGGSANMAGAAILMTQAAIRSGVGLVYSIVPPAIQQSVVCVAPSALVQSSTENKASSKTLAASLLDVEDCLLYRSNSVAIGPGLGINNKTTELILRILNEVNVPLILDADAITILATSHKAREIARTRVHPLILTPHPGEMTRLLGEDSTKNIQQNRIEAAQKASQSYHASVVLKGAQSIIAHPDGNVYINPTGNSGLAKGGSGDLLTGLVAGLMAQKVAGLGADESNDQNAVRAASQEALELGVYLHGLAADIALETNTAYTMTSDDWLATLPEAFKHLVKSKNTSD